MSSNANLQMLHNEKKRKKNNNKKKSAEWKVSWERENTKVAHFSGVATRRESIKETHTQAVLRQTT